jgi:hypothetical protein
MVMENNKLYMLWTDIGTGDKYKIGELYKEDETYYFKYILEEVKRALEKGFQLLVAFPQLNALYDNPQLFAVFSARLPDRRRPEIKKILETYGMTEYDEFELLKRSKGKTQTDNYEFEQ